MEQLVQSMFSHDNTPIGIQFSPVADIVDPGRMQIIPFLSAKRLGVNGKILDMTMLIDEKIYKNSNMFYI